MSTAYSEFLPEVLPYVRDCPDIAAINALRNASIEFCDKSHWLLYHHSPVNITLGAGTYTMDPPADTVVARILDAWFNGTQLAPIAEDSLKRMYVSDWRYVTGTPAFYTHLDPSQVTLSPVPDKSQSGALKMIVALRPTRASTVVDDSLYERWAEYIGFGARARLHEINGQPFYDPNIAARCRAMFERGIGMATIERNRGLTRHVAYAKFPPVV